MLLENKIKLNRVCPICSSNYAYKIYELKASKDEKEKVLSKSNIVLCDNCNFIFDDSSYTQKDYDEHYQFGETFATNSAGSGGSRDTDIQRYDFQIDKIVKHLKDKNANILDIGCAKGGLLKRFIDRGYKNIYAIEPEKSCVDILRKDNIDAKLGSIFDINIAIRLAV